MEYRWVIYYINCDSEATHILHQIWRHALLFHYYVMVCFLSVGPVYTFSGLRYCASCLVLLPWIISILRTIFNLINVPVYHTRAYLNLQLLSVAALIYVPVNTFSVMAVFRSSSKHRINSKSRRFYFLTFIDRVCCVFVY